MDNSIQILSFLVSFVFGFLFSLLSRYHYDMVYSLKKIMRYVLTFLFILDMSLLYILILYYVNEGVVHLYFVIVTFLGYGLEKYCNRHVKKNVKWCYPIAKFFQK